MAFNSSALNITVSATASQNGVIVSSAIFATPIGSASRGVETAATRWCASARSPVGSKCSSNSSQSGYRVATIGTISEP